MFFFDVQMGSNTFLAFLIFRSFDIRSSMNLFIFGRFPEKKNQFPIFTWGCQFFVSLFILGILPQKSDFSLCWFCYGIFPVNIVEILSNLTHFDLTGSNRQRNPIFRFYRFYSASKIMINSPSLALLFDPIPYSQCKKSQENKTQTEIKRHFLRQGNCVKLRFI